MKKALKKALIEAIKKFLKIGDSVEKIAEAMEFPIEKVQKIKDEMITE